MYKWEQRAGIIDQSVSKCGGDMKYMENDSKRRQAKERVRNSDDKLEAKKPSKGKATVRRRPSYELWPASKLPLRPS